MICDRRDGDAREGAVRRYPQPYADECGAYGVTRSLLCVVVLARVGGILLRQGALDFNGTACAPRATRRSMSICDGFVHPT